jgi:hypothetical protein
VAIALALTGAAPALGAQARPGAAPGDSIWITPDRRYDAGPLHRFLLGDLRRELWATPVRVEVLDLGRFAGGLTPVSRGGGQQTRSLRLRGGDSRLYTFRVIDKDASLTLDPELRRSIAAKVLQDQVGALMPLSALVVSPLLDSARVLNAKPRLAVLPDDPRLGEFRAEFAGVLGFIEVRPDEGPDGQPGFAGSRDIIDSNELFERLEQHPRNRIDARAFLRARLLDIFVGDWDRHPDQWRWAGFDEDGGTRFEPIPRDRDWALARLDGVLARIAQFAFPNYVGFDRDYPSAFAATWTGRALDRRLLSGTSRDEWDAVAAELVPRLSDATIEQAVRELPQPYFERVGPALIDALKTRRDHLPGMAAEFYRLLAGWADIQTTDQAESAVIERLDERRVRVEVSLLDDSAPFLARTFHANETKEIRVFLEGGGDRAVVRGAGRGEIRIRVTGGGGDDVLIDQTSGAGVHFYDARGDNEYTLAAGTRLDTTEWEQPLDPSSATHRAKARDWGSYWIPLPAITSEPDLGLYVGLGAIRWGYGFRFYPWRSRLAFSVGFGTGTGRFRAQVDYDFPVARGLSGRLSGHWSGVERNRFYGFGNETLAGSPRETYQADRSEFTAAAVATTRPAPGLELSAGPMLRVIRHYENAGTLLDSIVPYGTGSFDMAGLSAALSWDRRDRRIAARRGVLMRVDARLFPATLDAAEPFAGLRGHAAAYLSPPIAGRPTLAVRLGGEKVWGDPPYFEAAYLGGGQTLRGFSHQRFAGLASTFANAELRVRLADVFVFLPGTIGALGLADTGRVYARDEDSDRWHSAAGGGIWLSFLGPANTLSIAMARSAERTGLYIRAGFMF